MRRSGFLRFTRTSVGALAALAVIAGLIGPRPAQSADARHAGFPSPGAAVSALVAAARSNRTAELVRILGPGSEKLVSSGDTVADKNGREKFLSSYAKAHELDTSAAGRVTLLVGDDRWPLPIPIVQSGNVWRFDTKAAEQEILARRIGRNELSAIEVCRAYVDAQREYASIDRLGDGVREYARKFTSAKGKHDGLYWPVQPGEAASPMGPLVASAHAEGYRRQPYHGYYYRILEAQGKNASGGAYSYMAKKRMIGGFALVAYPAEWGNSGVMTFLVNQDGIVYEKNLGAKTEAIARAMTAFDPDASWKTP